MKHELGAVMYLLLLVFLPLLLWLLLMCWPKFRIAVATFDVARTASGVVPGVVLAAGVVVLVVTDAGIVAGIVVVVLGISVHSNVQEGHHSSEASHANLFCFSFFGLLLPLIMNRTNVKHVI